MISFDPEDIPERVRTAKTILEGAFGGCDLDDFFYEDSDLSDYDDIVITLETTLESLRLNDTEESPAMTVAQFLQLSKDFVESNLISRSVVHGLTRSIYLVSPNLPFADDYYSSNEERVLLEAPYVQNNVLYSVKLLSNSLLFATHLASDGGCDDSYNPPWGVNNFFIEVNCEAGWPTQAREEILQSFIFEVDTSSSVCLQPIHFPKLLDNEDLDDIHYCSISQTRLRSLQLTRGISEVLQIFNRAARSSDTELAFLGYVRVLEYVSASVVREQTHRELRSKLLLPEALAPTAEYIDSLQQTLEAVRLFRTDAEAMKLTLEACSDPAVLARFAPKYLPSLASISDTSKQDEKRKAIRDLAETFSATRNQFSHAKANYAKKGTECPPADLEDLTACARFAAQEALRYLSDMPERLRVL